MRSPPFALWKLFASGFLVCFALSAPARGEVILQYFESDWNEIYQRIPEIAEVGYDGIWTPTPCKSPQAGTFKWGNVGYSLYDRFDLGDIPQRGTLETRYGSRGDLRNMVDNLHFCDVKIYPDIVINHNGNGPDYRNYPGFLPNDFHVWQDNSQPGGWKRAVRMTGYDDVSNGYGQTFQQELVSLTDIVTEPDQRFSNAAPNYAHEPTPFVRHPGQYDKYPYNPAGTLPSENVRQMLGRWAAWLGNAMDYDGFRIDAAKHVVREFFGDPNTGFLHEAQYNFAQRRGIAFDPANFDQFQNGIRRKQMLNFAEIFTGSSGSLDYWRQGNVKMRYLDFPLKQGIIGGAFANNGNLASLASIGAALDPTEGVIFVQSHDQPAPDKLELAYAYLLTHVGVPIVYFSGNNISWSDYNTKTWVKPGIGSALGDFNGVITNLVYVSNQFARGREWGRWSEQNFYAFERYEDLNNSGASVAPDSGEATLLVALNNSGSNQTRTLATSFPNGTKLHDHTGNQTNDVTVANGQVTVTVPTRGGQGFVCYAPLIATPLGEPVRFLQNAQQAGTINWIVPGGRDATAKTRAIPRLTGNSVDIEVDYNDPVGGAVNNVLVKWGQGRQVNATATFFNGNDVVSGGFQQASYVGPAGKWHLVADLTGVPEGLHVIKARLFNLRPAGQSAVFQTFSKVVYVDRTGPSVNIQAPGDGQVLNGDVVAILSNDDKTADRVEARIDGGTWSDAAAILRGSWKFSVNGLNAGNHTLEVRATEFDHGNPKVAINSSTATRNFSVTAGGPNIAINHIEGAAINLPFFQTIITVDGNVAASAVKLWWDGYQMTGLTGTGTITHTFDGRYISGGVENRLYGAFINGPHFLEAEVTVNGQTKRVVRKVTFNLYGNNQVDSDGDGIPDEIEWPGTIAGRNPNEPLPGDSNQDAIPNFGESWSRINPLNQDTNYNGTWDGDEDSDGDGVMNLEEVRQGFLRYGDPYHYNIYDANNKPTGTVAAQATWGASNTNGQVKLAINYRPNDGALATTNPIYVHITTNNGASDTFLMTNAGGGLWTYTYMVPAGAQTVTLVFQNSTGATTDGNAGYANINVVVAAAVFVMDGVFDSNNYEVANSGMKILAALHGTKLYVATWSPRAGANDHFVFVTDKPDTSQGSPWAKLGTINFKTSTRPWLVGESAGTTPFVTFNNGGASARSIMGASGQALEGEIDLMETFGSVPKILYLAAVAYATNDGGGIASQCPPVFDGDNNLQITELQPVAAESIRDENLDGYFDTGSPSMETVVNGSTLDGNYGLRRFFLNELAKESAQITVNFYPHLAPGAPAPEVQLLSNLNRRDFATLEQDLSTLSTADNTVYTRAYAMTAISNNGYTITLPVNKCGAYRINARYRVSGGPWIYYTDHAQRRDCAVVVSPKKAQTAVMYEVNPSIVEATASTFAGRSTFRDLFTANVDRPDVINPAHFQGLGVNTVWLQPIHPIGSEAKGTDPLTSAPYDPGSPYAVRDYWSVSPVLGADNTGPGALTEFVNFVQQMDSIGVSVMMDGTFNHSAPDALLGQGAADLFGLDPAAKIRDVRPQWFSKSGRYDQPATSAADIAVAPDRTDFGKWNDVRDFYFGDYDALVKDATDATQQDYLLERDEFAGHTASTRELWEYFAYYPIYWLTKTGCPPGTPPEQSGKGIDGLRCDFAQGLPSQFWEYCINKTRSVKWDFLFMAESLDGYRTVGSSKRHGVGYRSARQFDILNENIVFYWRDQFFAYPANGQGSGGTANRTTFPTYQAYDDRRNAYDNVVLLNNLTSHDEVFPSNDPYAIFYAYAEVAALDGIPMLLYGQEAGAKNDLAAYGFSGVANSNNNWDSYELNFGKSIPNFKRYNAMGKVWQNRDWNLQTLYGRINSARKTSPALRNQNVYFLTRSDTGSFDPDMFAVAKYQEPGVSAAWQDVVFAFANNNYSASSVRWATFNLNAVTTTGANRFGIQPTHHYNVANLLAADPAAHLWSPDRLGSEIISTGIVVGLTTSATSGGQAQYLKLIDTTESHASEPNNYVSTDFDGDGMSNDWEIANGLNPQQNDANGDRDKDGMSNYEEFLGGTNPNDSASKLEVRNLSKAGEDVDLSWRSVPGQNYRIGFSSDLVTWQDFTNSNNTPFVVTADGAETTVRMTMPGAVGIGRMFFRIELRR